ncbi:MAG: N-acetylneuraminate synthase family protein [Candidatus Paceibacterota bacterium]|jgi:N-acetylneuraminate synthase
MQPLKFGTRIIGGPRTLIIAEIADSHNGSMETAKKLVDAAKAAGADVAKFQLHLVGKNEVDGKNEMIPGSIDMWDGPLYEILQRNLFTFDMHKEIKEYCEKVGIEYLCTPFCAAAVDVLENLNVKAFKTGSGELDNLPQHRRIAQISAKTGKPVIVSTGMCTWDEIADTVKVYEEEGAKGNLVLTNCTSEYPPNDYSHANLGLIPKLQKEFGVWVGQSDHTMDNYTAYAAVALGAKVIEKHLTLDRNQKGPDHAIALEPHMFKDLVDGIRKIEIGLGSEKSITKEEQVVRDWAFHTATSFRDIKKGEEFTLQNLIERRPLTMTIGGKKILGIPSKYLDKMYSSKLLGRKATRDIPKDTMLTWRDVA